MTTIAYNKESNEIAWDSRSVNSGVIISDSAEKLLMRNGVKFWFAGCVSDRRRFMDIYFGESVGEFTPDCDAIVFDGELFNCGITDKGELWKEPIESSFALGSGCRFALAAMDFGKSAKEAVEYVKTRCVFTGGEVQVMDLSTGKFKGEQRGE